VSSPHLVGVADNLRPQSIDLLVLELCWLTERDHAIPSVREASRSAKRLLNPRQFRLAFTSEAAFIESILAAFHEAFRALRRSSQCRIDGNFCC
jgi:hypothetical protein